MDLEMVLHGIWGWERGSRPAMLGQLDLLMIDVMGLDDGKSGTRYTSDRVTLEFGVCVCV
jgi:hypothetical protein